MYTDAQRARRNQLQRARYTQQAEAQRLRRNALERARYVRKTQVKPVEVKQDLLKVWK